MAWPFVKTVLKARVSGVAYELLALALQAMQGGFDSLTAWTARGPESIISAVAEAHGGVLLMLSRLSKGFGVLLVFTRTSSIPCLSPRWSRTVCTPVSAR
jgi:hypothetical protein